MAERLTGKDEKGTFLVVNGCCIEKEYFTDMRETMNAYYAKQLIDKLCAFEDILEKYGFDVEKLNQMLEWLFTLSGQDADDMKFIARDRKLIHQQYCDIKTDRDTWKRACELACEREDDCYVYDNIHRAYEFYQQAKQVTGKLQES